MAVQRPRDETVAGSLCASGDICALASRWLEPREGIFCSGQPSPCSETPFPKGSLGAAPRPRSAQPAFGERREPLLPPPGVPPAARPRGGSGAGRGGARPRGKLGALGLAPRGRQRSRRQVARPLGQLCRRQPCSVVEPVAATAGALRVKGSACRRRWSSPLRWVLSRRSP